MCEVAEVSKVGLPVCEKPDQRVRGKPDDDGAGQLRDRSGARGQLEGTPRGTCHHGGHAADPQDRQKDEPDVQPKSTSDDHLAEDESDNAGDQYPWPHSSGRPTRRPPRRGRPRTPRLGLRSRRGARPSTRGRSRPDRRADSRPRRRWRSIASGPLMTPTGSRRRPLPRVPQRRQVRPRGGPPQEIETECRHEQRARRRQHECLHYRLHPKRKSIMRTSLALYCTNVVIKQQYSRASLLSLAQKIGDPGRRRLGHRHERYSMIWGDA